MRRMSRRWLDELEADMAAVILGDGGRRLGVAGRLDELSEATLPGITRYWARVGRHVGVPCEAFRGESLFHDVEPPVRSFSTSGTTGSRRGAARYSQRGMRLLELTIRTGAAALFDGLDEPIVLRLVPTAADAPQMVMAFGMELISDTFGAADLSAALLTRDGVDVASLCARLDTAQASARPVVFMGATTAFANVLDALAADHLAWDLPPGSRMVDAGGSKGARREVTPDSLRVQAHRLLGIDSSHCTNLYGMTELAGQLYDANPEAVVYTGERAKASRTGISAEVLSAETLAAAGDGRGLLQVRDFAIIDRPHHVLTGDLAIATPAGPAVVGRVARSMARGCSLHLDAITATSIGRVA